MWWIMMSLAAMAAVAGSTAQQERNADEEVMSCEVARMRCAYRVGCGKALQHYVMGCSAVLQGMNELAYCPEICQNSLIALTSTEEGKQLMTCQCSDESCEDAKRRVEVCRPSVTMANLNDSVVSCRVAQWICSADAVCSAALEYYNRYCKSMFHGKKCNNRCRNSISILRRQDKAAKLKTCKCDGQEDFNCVQIQNNMARLCFHKKIHEEPTEPPGDIDTNVIRDEYNPRTQNSGNSLSQTMNNNKVGSLLLLVILIAIT
ncbi:growth arrest-specific protein 1-like [Agrilus planipennis]|uniref:Growth arrest-specific protein 1-like n=1 Tax=Agrilus planipennis TaxID=224129 RepID=A0A1W4WMS4_AGRPL|nr:growth arrest-specific protein 1-like [Agrilus planipennis]XP_018325218.1 growth arrest-specific protein 1-like [Agrilus planipennis]XP_018325219.1 growth arrest-specific protein 1-like [Agrilus planipennis]